MRDVYDDLADAVARDRFSALWQIIRAEFGRRSDLKFEWGETEAVNLPGARRNGHAPKDVRPK